MSFNWDKKANQPPKPWEQPPPQPLVLDEQAMAALQEDPEIDIFEEEDDNITEIMSDVNLRLEQGRLYQMVLKGDIFGDTDADPRAVKNVTREIRKFMRERMETMVGIRQEQLVAQTIVSSPFNDMEVEALKMVASKVTKGASEAQPQATPQLTPAVPKKDGITTISGNLRPSNNSLKSTPAPASKKASPKPQPKAPAKSALTESILTKPIDQMTQEELIAYNAEAAERSKRQYAAMPNNLVPHPTAQGLEMMYTQAAGNMINASNANAPWRN